MSEPLDALLDQAYSRGLNDALRQMRAIDLAANTLDLDSPEAVERLARATARVVGLDEANDYHREWAAKVLAALREQP